MSGDAEKPENKSHAAGNKNIILIGMMGTGKSTVGTLLAEELNFEFIDLDHAIIEQENRTIPEIFAQNGEAYFREIETAVLKRVLQTANRVVSTGGGAVLAPENASFMLENGLVVALTATAEDIIARVGGDMNRPLLAGNAAEQVKRIMKQRRDAYLFAHCTVDTTGLGAAQVSQHILTHYRG